MRFMPTLSLEFPDDSVINVGFLPFRCCCITCYILRMTSKLKAARISAGTSMAAVAKAVGVNRSTLHRIEAGDVAPTRRVARALFEYYGGKVPLVHIYDPEYAAQAAA